MKRSFIFIWTHDFERMYDGQKFDQSDGIVSSADAVVGLFKIAAGFSEHYYSARVTMYEINRDWKCITRSAIYRKLSANARLFGGVALMFEAVELQKVISAPQGSIVVPKFEAGGYRFEVVRPTDPDYSSVLASLPGAA